MSGNNQQSNSVLSRCLSSCDNEVLDILDERSKLISKILREKEIVKNVSRSEDDKFKKQIIDNNYQPNTKIKFDDISGLHVIKQRLKEIVARPMVNPQLFTGFRTPA